MKLTTVIRFVICVSFGAYLTTLGYTVNTRQFWILLGLFISYGVVRSLEKY